MAQFVKIEGLLVLVVKLSSPADEVYSLFENQWQVQLFPQIMPLDIKKVEYDGSGLRCWTFVNDDCGIWKDKVVENDHDAMKVTWTLMEGSVPLSFYNSLKVKFQFTPGNAGCLATATLEFNKKSVNVDPQDYMNFIREMLKAVDQYLQGPAGN